MTVWWAAIPQRVNSRSPAKVLVRRLRRGTLRKIAASRPGGSHHRISSTLVATLDCRKEPFIVMVMQLRSVPPILARTPCERSRQPDVVAFCPVIRSFCFVPWEWRNGALLGLNRSTDTG